MNVSFENLSNYDNYQTYFIYLKQNLRLNLINAKEL